MKLPRIAICAALMLGVMGSQALPEARAEKDSVGSGPCPTRDVVVRPGARGEKTVTVAINAEPWARIWIDGRPLGETPLVDVPVALGKRAFCALFPDGRRVERTVDVDGEGLEIQF